MNYRYCRFFCFAILALLSLTSCFKIHRPPKETYVEHEYGKFYRVTELRCGWARGDDVYIVRLLPTLTEASAEKMEIVSFYGNKAVYRGRQYYYVIQMTGPDYSPIRSMNAVDWRITEIDLIALNDWDSTHPEGSSLKELFSLRYLYNDSVITVPLNELTFGSFMLSDTPSDDLEQIEFYPSSPLFHEWSPVLFFEGDFSSTFPKGENGLFLPESIKHVKICIKDAFGGIYECEI